MRTSTSALLSEPSNASPLFSDDELAVHSKGVVASISALAQHSSCIFNLMSSGYSKSGLSEWIITFKPWLLPRIQGRIGYICYSIQTGLELASFPRPPCPVFVACSTVGRPGRFRHVIRAAICKWMRGAVSPTSLRPHKLLP